MLGRPLKPKLRAEGGEDPIITRAGDARRPRTVVKIGRQPHVAVHQVTSAHAATIGVIRAGEANVLVADKLTRADQNEIAEQLVLDGKR